MIYIVLYCIVMDVGEITVYLQSVVSLNEKLINIIKDQCRKNLEIILIDIAETTGCSLSELRGKYLSNIDLVEFANSYELAKSKKTIDSKIRCCAKTCKGDRCTRKLKKDKFCGSHEHSRPYGEIVNSDNDHLKHKPIVLEKHKLNIETKQQSSDSEFTEPED